MFLFLKKVTFFYLEVQSSETREEHYSKIHKQVSDYKTTTNVSNVVLHSNVRDKIGKAHHRVHDQQEDALVEHLNFVLKASTLKWFYIPDEYELKCC